MVRRVLAGDVPVVGGGRGVVRIGGVLRDDSVTGGESEGGMIEGVETVWKKGSLKRMVRMRVG
jgi:hypothetical protein